MNKLKNYIKQLLKEKVDEGSDIFIDKYKDIPNRENIAKFIDLINLIYDGEKIAIFVTPFVEKIENFVAQPVNIDLVEKMFKIIHDEIGTFNLILSGTFGIYIFDAIEEGKIAFDGDMVVVSGRIRKIDLLKEVVILKQKGVIQDKDFILLDDSYVYGGTRDRIQEFLNKYNSEIIKTFVFYTHYIEKSNDVYSSFCYETDIDERIVPIHKQFDFINKVDLKLFSSYIKSEIYKGNITQITDLYKTLKKILDIKKNESNIVSKYKTFTSLSRK